jgi:hypothetical protein
VCNEKAALSVIGVISGEIAYALRLSLARRCADPDHHYPLADYGPPLTDFFLTGVVFLAFVAIGAFMGICW